MDGSQRSNDLFYLLDYLFSYYFYYFFFYLSVRIDFREYKPNAARLSLGEGVSRFRES